MGILEQALPPLCKPLLSSAGVAQFFVGDTSNNNDFLPAELCCSAWVGSKLSRLWGVITTTAQCSTRRCCCRKR